MEPPGRLFQDDNFDVAHLTGRLVERIGYVCIEQPPESDGHILYVKPVDGSWNRGFLDVGFAVWEDWGDSGPAPPEALDEDNDVYYVDCSDRFRNRVIQRVFARAEVDRMPRLHIEFEDGGRLELRVADEANWDSDSVIVIHATV